MKQYIAITAAVLGLSPLQTNAQKIGINTETPAVATTLHIDAAGDTAAKGNTADDVVITETGQLGIGTSTPRNDVKVEINGSFKMSGGGEADRILMSDPHGNASWQYFSLGDFATLFQIEGYIPPGSTQDGVKIIGSGQVQMLPNQLGLSTNGSSSVTIPKGRYLISMESNIEDINEYGTAELWNKTDDVMLFHTTYQIYQSGTAIYIDLDKDSEIEVHFLPIDAYAKGLDYIAPLPYANPKDASEPLKFFVRLSIVRIQGNFDEVI